MQRENEPHVSHPGDEAQWQGTPPKSKTLRVQILAAGVGLAAIAAVGLAIGFSAAQDSKVTGEGLPVVQGERAEDDGLTAEDDAVNDDEAQANEPQNEAGIGAARLADVIPVPSREAGIDLTALDGGSVRRDLRPSYNECQDWVGRRFLMTVYSVPTEHDDTRTVAELAQEGFTHVGPWYMEDRWTSGAAAAQNGLCTVFPVGLSIEPEEAMADLPRAVEAIRSDMQRVLDDSSLNATVSAWSMLPEEMNVYRNGHEELLIELANTIKANDPLGRPVYMYLQSNADPHQFEVNAVHTEILGQGNYLSTNGLADQRVHLKSSILRSIKAREVTGQDQDTVMPVVEHRIHSGTLADGQSQHIETWVRHDLMTTFALGTDGFIAFSGFPPKQGIDDFARYNDAYTQVMAEIEATSLAEFYYRGIHRPEITGKVVSGPATLSMEVLYNADPGEEVETHNTVSVRGWGIGPILEVVVVNHANEAVTVEIDGIQSSLKWYNALTGAEIESDGNTATLELGPYGTAILQGISSEGEID